jgi:hypothetical protein
MAYSIKKHEVDRLLNVAVVLGWELEEESYGNGDIYVKLHKKLSQELLLASGELEKGSTPQ